MAKTTCSYCGTIDVRASMIISKHTKNAWCRDEDACRHRVDRRVKGERRERAKAEG